MQVLPMAPSPNGLISARYAVITKTPGWEVLTTTRNVNVTGGGGGGMRPGFSWHGIPNVVSFAAQHPDLLRQNNGTSGGTPIIVRKMCRKFRTKMKREASHNEIDPSRSPPPSCIYKGRAYPSNPQTNPATSAQDDTEAHNTTLQGRRAPTEGEGEGGLPLPVP